MFDENNNMLETFLFTGANYDRLAYMSGFGAALYRKAAKQIPLQPGMRVLDLACGTGMFGRAVAERILPGGKVYGVDISHKQIEYAKKKVSKSRIPFEFHPYSMDDLLFKDNSFDAVVCSMTFHEVPSRVRRDTIKEVARVLKQSGLFALVDLSKPRIGRMGVAGALWYVSHPFDPAAEDHWKNTYPSLCRQHNLLQISDEYLNSTIRCQVFRKA